jgi:uncharacterized protein
MSAPSSSVQQTNAAPQFVQLAAPKLNHYKPSRFNAHTTTDDGVLLLYNSLTGKNCAIPAKNRQAAEKYLSVTGYSGPLDEVGKYLVEKGYVVEKHVDEDARWDVRYGLQQYRTDRLELILLASEECNFRCIYCSQQFKRDSMLPSVRAGVRNLILSRIKYVSTLVVDWFGGEPLMGYEAIEELAPFAQRITIEHGVRLRSGMTTNAYLLTPDRARNLVSWGVKNFQITLDGTALEHDSHRPLKEGGETFDVIMKNLVGMRAIEDTFNVAVRFNFDKTNVGKFDGLLAILKENLGGDPRFVIRLRPIGQWGGPNDDQLEVCGHKEITQHLVQLTTKAEKAGLPIEGLADSIAPGPQSVCYAARPWNMIIGADGNIYKCTVVLDENPDNIVGRIHEDGRVAINEDLFAKWVKPFYKEDPSCRKCFFVPVCQGAICPLPRVVSGERPCPTPKLEIQQTLKNVWEERRRNNGLKSARPSAEAARHEELLPA